MAPPAQQIQLYPTGWESSFESERYPLPLMGHIMPKIYVLVTEVFTLPSNANTQAIIRNMTAGLEFAISQFPVLAGVLEMDAATGRMWVATNRNGKVVLHVKHIVEEGEFPAYQELA